MVNCSAASVTAWIAPHRERRLDERVVGADVDVEVDRVDDERGRRVVLELDGFRLGFSHDVNVPQSDAAEHARAPAQCRFPRGAQASKAQAVGTRFANSIRERGAL
jgi:hypothetical protein